MWVGRVSRWRGRGEGVRAVRARGGPGRAKSPEPSKVGASCFGGLMLGCRVVGMWCRCLVPDGGGMCSTSVPSQPPHTTAEQLKTYQWTPKLQPTTSLYSAWPK